MNTTKKPLRKDVKKPINNLLKNTSTSITVVRIVTDIVRIFMNVFS